MKSLIIKIKHSINGIYLAFLTQNSFKIHVISAIFVLVLSYFLGLSFLEWSYITSAILFVLVSEMFNTAIELICNFVHMKFHRKIRRIKDVSAGAVFIAVVNSLIVGGIIIVPKLLRLIW